MQLSGRRIHIAGSSNRATEPSLVFYAHDLVRELVTQAAAKGANFLSGVGYEPRMQDDEPQSPAIVFDWTTIETITDEIAMGRRGPSGAQGPMLSVVASHKTDRQIPEHRRSMWDRLVSAGAVYQEFLADGWTSGHARRQRQAEIGDVLVILGGGEGVEHLAQEYAAKGKPIIPLDLNLGASTDDGSGGAPRLHRKALAEPETFFRLQDRSGGSTMLSTIQCRDMQRPIQEVARNTLALMEAVAPPTAFYVRLLSLSAPEITHVDKYFREVVEPAVAEFGYASFVMGRDEIDYAWMNQEIFERLHHSDLVIADLTGVRPNCFFELGYALGNRQRTLVIAMQGTERHFDLQMINRLDWDPNATTGVQSSEFRDHWRRNIDRPPLVDSPKVI